VGGARAAIGWLNDLVFGLSQLSVCDPDVLRGDIPFD
jgi:hypothetical protein